MVSEWSDAGVCGWCRGRTLGGVAFGATGVGAATAAATAAIGCGSRRRSAGLWFRAAWAVAGAFAAGWTLVFGVVATAAAVVVGVNRRGG